jgi:hypothetical protein
LTASLKTSIQLRVSYQKLYLPGLALIFFGLVVGVRLRLLGLPLERDEGEYAYMAQQLLQGILPYTESQSMKFPGIYFVYTGILIFFGETPSAIHLSIIFINLATAYFIFLLGKNLLNLSAGIVAAVCFSVLTLSPALQGVWANSEHFVLLPALAGIFLLRMAREQPALFFLSGLLLGCSLLIKQHAVLFSLFGVLYLGFRFFSRPKPIKKKILYFGLFALGNLLPLILSVLFYTASGKFSDFWFCTVQYASEYVSFISLAGGFENFKYNFARILESNFTILWLSVIGIASIAWVRDKNQEYLFLFGFFLCSFLAITPGLYFRAHYFLLWMPALSLFAAVGFDGLVYPLSSLRIKNIARVGVFILALGVPFLIQKDVFFKLSNSQVTRQVYGLNPFLESFVVARYILNHSKKDDQIAVLGSEPQIYFFSHRKSATRYIYMYPLMERHVYARKMQTELIHEIEATKPKFVVVANLGGSWVSPRPYISPILKEWAQGYLNGKYKIQGVVDILTNKVTVYKWGEEAKGYHPQSRFNLLIYKKLP